MAMYDPGSRSDINICTVEVERGQYTDTYTHAHTQAQSHLCSLHRDASVEANRHDSFVHI